MLYNEAIMKKLIIVVCVVLCTWLLPACGDGDGVNGGGDGGGGGEMTVAVAFDKVEGSRDMAVVVTVNDENGLPLAGAEVAYEQVSQAFMYNVGQYWDEGSRDAGTNTMGIYLDWQWGDLEPQDDVYDWSRLEDTGELDAEGRLREESAENIFLRIGVIATSAWIVGEGMDDFTDPGYPDWIDQNDLEQVKNKYLEFVPALIDRLQFSPDFYMIELEINALGPHTGMTNEEVIDWMEQLADVIKTADANARIAVTIGAQDLSPFMEWAREINPELVAQDRYQLPVTDFLERMRRVDYDIIAVIMQPFGWMSQGDWEDARDFLEGLGQFDKDIYIGWASFLAEEPVVPAVLDPNPNNVNGEGGFVYYPNPEGHSPQWQCEQSLALMDFLIANPRVIGVHWNLLDYTEYGVGGQYFQVKLATGFTTGYRDENNEIVPGEKRPVYDEMKQLWFALFARGTATTDANGEAAFSGWGGDYEISVSHPDYGEKSLTVEIY